MKRIIDRLSSRFPHSDIGDGRGSTFFRRYDLFKCRWGAAYLHVFFRSDHDRCLHDHPWPFWTFILRGGYWEIVPAEGWEITPSWFGWLRYRTKPLPAFSFDPDGPGSLNPTRRVWRRVGYFGRYPATHAHRIEIEPDTRPVSLVFVGRKRRPWGFWGPSGWVAWVKGQPNPICETGGPS